MKVHQVFHVSNPKLDHTDLKDANQNKLTRASVKVTTITQREVKEILPGKKIQ